MRKILLLSSLLALPAIPATAQTDTDRIREKAKAQWDDFYAYAIQSFGWKCDQVKDVSVRHTPFTSLKVDDYVAMKIVCENNLTYYLRYTMDGNTLNKEQLTFCQKGTCKKF